MEAGFARAPISSRYCCCVSGGAATADAVLQRLLLGSRTTQIFLVGLKCLALIVAARAGAGVVEELLGALLWNGRVVRVQALYLCQGWYNVAVQVT